MLEIFYRILGWCFSASKVVQLKLFRQISPLMEAILRFIAFKAKIRFNGENKWDLQIKDKEFYARVSCDSTLGIGETYMEGMWECEAVDEMSYRIFQDGLYTGYIRWANLFSNFLCLRGFNQQTRANAWKIGEKHYDQGNEMFESFLDPYMNYSCGYWKNADNLNQAQQDKMELIAQKLRLEPGMRVLDIGCGWGGLCKYLAENHKVKVVGCTISKEGVKYAQKFCKDLPVDIRLVDYRDLDEKFDRIVSVGMFEHIGPANYAEFFKVVHRCLEEDGIFLLHTIGVYNLHVAQTEPWFHTYIFPGIFPYCKEIVKNTTGLFIMEDWQNMGCDYDKTFMAWNDNLTKAWPKLSATRSEQFLRMWKYFFLTSAGAFRSRTYHLWQIVLSKNGIRGGYYAPR